MLVPTYNPSMQKTGGSQVGGQPGLQRELKARRAQRQILSQTKQKREAQ
jgi:hypothetical protein